MSNTVRALEGDWVILEGDVNVQTVELLVQDDLVLRGGEVDRLPGMQPMIVVQRAAGVTTDQLLSALRT